MCLIKVSETDFKIIRSYGFRIVSDDSNPRIKDRVTACNAGFKNANGVIQLKVNVEKTSAVWLGIRSGDRPICQDLRIQWATEFTQLGIRFTAVLENMQVPHNGLLPRHCKVHLIYS